MPRKRKLELKTYQIVEEAVELGVQSGWQHAHKHTDTPDIETIKAYIAHDIMLLLDEIIKWDS